jgi:predicted PurR-regulated permease PerM
VRRGLPRWAAVTAVCVGLLAAFGGFLAAVTRLGDEIATRVSEYVLGNLVTSLVTAVLVSMWLLITLWRSALDAD